MKAVESDAGGHAARRVFRARLRNPGRAAAAVVLLDVALPGQSLLNAKVLMRQPLTIGADARLRV